MTRIILKATEGKVLTNGDIYATEIYLSDKEEKENFYEINKEDMPIEGEYYDV